MENTINRRPSTLGAIFLVTGCCIGAGMIGLPMMSALAGFLPSTLAMVFCYFFTTITGLLLLEATLWFPHTVNLISIVEFSLGKVGKYFTWILFLFLFYCLFVAYMDGGGDIINSYLTHITHKTFAREVGIAICVSFVFLITYCGTHFVDKINRILLISLVIAYCLLVSAGIGHVSKANLAITNWNGAIATIPILFICFGYQNLVPTLTQYLKRNHQAVQLAIIIGNALPFFIYLLWNFVILGLYDAKNVVTVQTNIVEQLLQGVSHSPVIGFSLQAFAMFALLTSFIPNTVTFVHFLKDGFKLHMDNKHKYELLIYLLVFVPPLICTLIYPSLFLKALDFAGGFVDVLLFGVLPALVILVGRYQKQMQGEYQVIGGKSIPILILIFSIIILLIKHH